MDFAFVADVPWWCLSRDGLGIADANESDHTWKVLHAREDGSSDFDKFDVVRFGAVPLFTMFRDVLPSGRRSVISVCSFRDAGFDLYDPRIPWDRVLGVVYNDHRQAEFVERCPVRAYYCPGKVSADEWMIEPSLHPLDGPLRVGWAGSETAWPGVKNVDLLEKACVEAGVEFVRQRRETDGRLGPAEMLKWFNSLDLYACANIELSCTPVSVLEAMRSGVPVMTTKCGEVWPILRALAPELVVDDPSLEQLRGSLLAIRHHGRRWLQELGYRVRDQSDVLTWEDGEATRLTEVIAQWAS